MVINSINSKASSESSSALDSNMKGVGAGDEEHAMRLSKKRRGSGSGPSHQKKQTHHRGVNPTPAGEPDVATSEATVETGVTDSMKMLRFEQSRQMSSTASSYAVSSQSTQLQENGHDDRGQFTSGTYGQLQEYFEHRLRLALFNSPNSVTRIEVFGLRRYIQANSDNIVNNLLRQISSYVFNSPVGHLNPPPWQHVSEPNPTLHGAIIACQALAAAQLQHRVSRGQARIVFPSVVSIDELCEVIVLFISIGAMRAMNQNRSSPQYYAAIG